MKKFLLGSLLVCSLNLVACSNNNDERAAASENTESKTEATATDYELEEEGSDVMEMSFEDGRLEAAYVNIDIEKTQVVHDNFSDEDGLVVWYSTENNSEDNVVPSEVFDMFVVKQQDGSTEYDLTSDVDTFDSSEALYPMYDETGEPIEDTDKYNSAIDDQKQFNQEFEEPAYNDLLPDKTVQTAVGIPLNNTDYPVTISIGEDFPTNTNEEYEISL